MLRRTLRYIISFAFAALALTLFSLSACAEEGTLDIMVYMVASDLESDYSAASRDINEMLAGMKNAGAGLRLLVCAGGAETWHSDYVKPGETSYLKIDGKGAESVYSEKAVCMTEPEALTAFISFCAREYPADRNILILWDHGGGASCGFGKDELFPDSDSLNMLELYDALKESGVHFDLVGYDACLMGTVETCLSTMGLADYLLCSEELEPTDGWNYTEMLRMLAEDTRTDTKKLCEAVCDSYIGGTEPGKMEKITLAAVDLRIFEKLVPDALEKFSRSLRLRIQTGGLDLVASARGRAGARIGSVSENNAVDAICFAEYAQVNGSREFADALRSSIVCCRSSSEDCTGLSLMMPFSMTGSTEDYTRRLYELRRVGIAGSYYEWLKVFGAYMSYVQETVGQEITLLDVLNGNVKPVSPSGSSGDGLNENALSIIDAQLRALKKVRLSVDENGVMHLDMPEEDRKLIESIVSRCYRAENGEYRDYGLIRIEADRAYDFPDGLYGALKNSWFTINGSFCPFYSVSIEQTGAGNTLIYGYSMVFMNGKPGRLYSVSTFSPDGEYADSQILCFQKFDFREESEPFGRLLPASTFNEGDRISVVVFEYRTDMICDDYEPLGIELTWGGGISFGWEKCDTDKGICGREYYVVDVFGNIKLCETE